jgi:transcriptional regulator with XRE-family HTH domain
MLIIYIIYTFEQMSSDLENWSNMNFKDNLKRIRIERGLSQTELAELTGLTQVTISHYETGSQTPNVKTADKIAHALGVTLNELLAES